MTKPLSWSVIGDTRALKRRIDSPREEVWKMLLTTGYTVGAWGRLPYHVAGDLLSTDRLAVSVRAGVEEVMIALWPGGKETL